MEKKRRHFYGNILSGSRLIFRLADDFQSMVLQQFESELLKPPNKGAGKEIIRTFTNFLLRGITGVVADHAFSKMQSASHALVMDLENSFITERQIHVDTIKVLFD